MAGTEYRLDGLDEWEQALAKAVNEQYPAEFETMVIQIAQELAGAVKEKTPKATGRLQNAWKVGEIKRNGNDYVIEVYNNVEYAEPVEYGHRQRTKTVKGSHMLELSLAELNAALPGFLREWLDNFLNTHDIV